MRKNMPEIVHTDRHYWNKTLALLLGWTNIEEMGGALLATPPNGLPNSRGQALVPDWTGSWEHCGNLMSQYSVFQVSPFTVTGEGGGKPNDSKVLQDRFASKFRIEVVRLVVSILRNQQTIIK